MTEEKNVDSPPSPENDMPERFMVKMPTRRPIVTYAILALTVAVFFVQLLSDQGLLFFGNCPYFFSPDIAACYGLKINEFIIRGQYWRLLSPILLHGSLLHIGFNMYALNILGPELERHFGHRSFLALYIASGFAGFVLSFLLTASPSLGASTAIFGLLAAQGIFIYRNQHIFGTRGRMALRSILNIAVINFAIGLSPGIDNWGHLGGLLGGLMFSWLATPIYKVGGEGPEFELINHRALGSSLQAFVLVVLIFSAFALTAIL